MSRHSKTLIFSHVGACMSRYANIIIYVYVMLLNFTVSVQFDRAEKREKDAIPLNRKNIKG